MSMDDDFIKELNTRLNTRMTIHQDVILLIQHYTKNCLKYDMVFDRHILHTVTNTLSNKKCPFHYTCQRVYDYPYCNGKIDYNNCYYYSECRKRIVEELGD